MHENHSIIRTKEQIKQNPEQNQANKVAEKSFLRLRCSG